MPKDSGIGANTREASKARTRERYLQEAARLFSERGFHAVSIETLGAAVGVSGPALYRHFSSKEAMLAEILTGTSARLLSGLEAIMDDERLSEAEKLCRLIDVHLDFALSSRDVIRLQDRELGTLPLEANRRVRRLQRSYLDSWAGLLTRLRPELSSREARVLMHAVFGILNSTAHNADLAPDGTTREVLSAAAKRALGLWQPLPRAQEVN